MKACHIIGLGLILFAIASNVGCNKSATPQEGSPNRQQILKESMDKVITIHADDDDPNKCEVDYPIALIRGGKHVRKHTITWYADDADYVVVFNNKGSPITTHGGNQAVNSITVPQGSTASNGPFELLKDPSSKGYATYEIWRKAAGSYTGNCLTGQSGYPCMCPQDDKDTGVIVKP